MISGYIFLSAGSRRWPTYLQDRSHAHTAGLLSTALPTTAQHDWLATSIWHTPVAASAVGVTVAQPGSLVASDHAAHRTGSSDLRWCTDALRCTRTSLRAYTRGCTCVPRTTIRRFSSRLYLPSATDLNLVKAKYLCWPFFNVYSAWKMPLYLAVPWPQTLILRIVWAYQRWCCSLHC